jgi:hypothetical protein
LASRQSFHALVWRVPLAGETDGDDLIEFALELSLRMRKKEKAKKGGRRRKGNYEFNLRERTDKIFRRNPTSKRDYQL